MMIEPLNIEAPMPDEAERRVAEKLSHALAERLAPGESVRAIMSGDKSGTPYALLVTATKLLVKILSEIAKGNAITVVTLKPELTIQEVGELLNISRPRLIKLLEDRMLPFHKVGTHRRIRLANILAYKRKSLEERKAILREMVALNQEMSLYD